MATQWVETIKITDHIKDVMFSDEFNRRCTAEFEIDLRAAGWTTQTFQVYGVEDGSKLRTHLTCIWAHRSPIIHDTLSYNTNWLKRKKNRRHDNFTNVKGVENKNEQ